MLEEEEKEEDLRRTYLVEGTGTSLYEPDSSSSSKVLDNLSIGRCLIGLVFIIFSYVMLLDSLNDADIGYIRTINNNALIAR